MASKYTSNDAGVEPNDLTTSTVVGSGDAFFSVPVANATARYAAAAAQHGPMGVRFTTTATGGTAYITLGLAAGATTAGAQAYLKFATLPAVTMTFGLVRSSAASNVISIQTTSAGKIVLLGADGVAMTGVDATYTLPTATKIRPWVKVTPVTTTTGVVEVKLFHNESTTESFSHTSSTVNLGTATAQYIRWGIVGSSGVSGYVLDADDFYINDTGVNPGIVTNDTVTAGSDQTVEPWSTVTLTATANTGTATWTQQSGTTVTLNGAGALVRTFTAPADFAGAALVFRATNGTATDDVSITVLPATDGLVVSTAPVVVVPIRLTVVT